MQKYKIGSTIKCQVTGIEKYGIFVNVDAYYDGLIHISEISSGFVKDINNFVQSGDTIYSKILAVDEENLQLKLSIKDIDYKIKKKPPKVEESKNGFKPLEEKLNIWINEKLQKDKK